MDLSRLRQIHEQKAIEADEQLRHDQLLLDTARTQEIIVRSFAAMKDFLENRVGKTEVVNQLQAIGTPDAFKVVDAVDSLHETLKTHENTDLSEVTQVMQAILEEAKQIPKEHPEEKEERDYSKQFESLLKATQAVEKVVKEQKLIAEAPIVNVPETKVEVTPPDLEPLQKNLKAVIKAVEGIVIPEYKTDNTAVEKLLKKTNKYLSELLDKPVSAGGGGGGLATPYVDDNGIPAFPQLTPSGALPVGTQSLASRFDEDSGTPGIYYKGTAEIASSEGDPVWQIKRIDTTTILADTKWADGDDSFNNVWTNREGLSYS